MDGSQGIGGHSGAVQGLGGGAPRVDGAPIQPTDLEKRQLIKAVTDIQRVWRGCQSRSVSPADNPRDSVSHSDSPRDSRFNKIPEDTRKYTTLGYSIKNPFLDFLKILNMFFGFAGVTPFMTLQKATDAELGNQNRRANRNRASSVSQDRGTILTPPAPKKAQTSHPVSSGLERGNTPSRLSGPNYNTVAGTHQGTTTTSSNVTGLVQQYQSMGLSQVKTSANLVGGHFSTGSIAGNTPLQQQMFQARGNGDITHSGQFLQPTVAGISKSSYVTAMICGNPARPCGAINHNGRFQAQSKGIGQEEAVIQDTTNTAEYVTLANTVAATFTGSTQQGDTVDHAKVMIVSGHQNQGVTLKNGAKATFITAYGPHANTPDPNNHRQADHHYDDSANKNPQIFYEKAKEGYIAFLVASLMTHQAENPNQPIHAVLGGLSTGIYANPSHPERSVDLSLQALRDALNTPVNTLFPGAAAGVRLGECFNQTHFAFGQLTPTQTNILKGSHHVPFSWT